MSAGGEDTKNLKEGENPTATLSEGIPNSSSKDISGTCGPKEILENSPLTSSKPDNTEDIEDIESLIEKKLPSDKEKGLDVDSELDFELKWDDDNELNENQGDIDDEDVKSASKDLESNIASKEKDILNSGSETDIDKEIDSAFTSKQEEPENVDKDTDSDFTSIEKDLDSLDQESDSALTASEKNFGDLGKEVERDLTSIEKTIESVESKTKSGTDIDSVDIDKDTAFKATDKDLDNLEKEIENTFIDKDSNDADSEVDSAMASVEKELDNEIQQALTSMGEGEALDTPASKLVSLDKDLDVNINAMDVDNVNEEIQTITKHNNPDTIQTDEDLLKTLEEGKTLNNSKIGTELNTSQIESESNSLDEELVYSDAEAPNIEDKDLMDQIDAQITATEISDGKLEYTDEIAPNIEDKDLMDDVDAQMTATETNDDKIKCTDTVQVSLELSTLEEEKSEESKTNKEDASHMDVDDGLTESIKVLEKSDPNDTHSSITDHESSTYDVNKEHGLDRPDVMIDIPTQELIETFDDCEETFEIADDVINKLDESALNIADKPDFNHATTTELQPIEDKMHSDKLNKANNASDNFLTDEMEKDKLTIETAETESMEVDSHDTFTETDKTVEVNVSKLNSSPINKQGEDSVSTLEEKVSHADIILEATTESKVHEEVTTCGLQEEVNKEIETSSNLEVKEVEYIQKRTEALPFTSMQEEQVESTDSLSVKGTEDISLATPVDKPEPSTSKQNKDVDSNSAKTKEVEAKDTNVEARAQPSTANHSELSDEDQETTDSLGLLAESSRVMDDDDEQEQEPEPDDDDDDDEFDQDDESNQMTAEHSEDSNAQQSEADVPREAMDIDGSNDAQDSTHDMAETDDAGDLSHSEQDDEKEDSNDEKEESNDEKVASNDEKVESNDEKDDSHDETDELDQIQIGEVVSQTVAEAVVKSAETGEETVKAVKTLLDDKKEESTDAPLEAVSVEDKDAVKPTETDSADVSKLRQLLLGDGESSTETEKKSPSKTKKLEISKPKNEINIVELEESSSEDDIQVVNKSEKPASPQEVTSVNIPSEVDVVVAGASSEVQQREGELLISGLPKPAPQKPARLNTNEVTIKTTPAATEPLVIPETKAPKSSEGKTAIDFGLEIFSLDSDDEETEVRSKRKSKLTAVELDKARQTNKCINAQCTSEGSVPLVPASMAAAVYYAANQQRGGGLCVYCAKRFEERSEKLVEGVKDLTPFLTMDMCIIREEFVEISDSDSEDEPDVVKDDAEIIGEKGAKFLEEQLADAFNDVWKKFNMEERLLSAQAEINMEVGQLEEECKQIDAMLNECQKETDKLRNDLYTAFADDRRELPAITICDTPVNQWSGLEEALTVLTPPPPPPAPEIRELPARHKRRAGAAPAAEPGAKRPAIPLGYAPLDGPAKPEPKPGPSAEVAAQNDDDNADISVVKLSVEAAPAGLPAPGTATRPPLRPNTLVYAMRNTFGAWHKVKIVEVQPKIAGQFTTCRVRFEQPKTMTKLLPARCLAYADPPDVRLTIGTRVIALFKDHRNSVDKKEETEKKEAYYSGIVAEIPNPVNSFRYLIFFDDGYAQYVQHAVTRLVCECAPRVWDEVHPFSRQFVRDYLRAYPERPMVRLHAGQSIKTEWDGKWWVSKVLQVDASLVLVYFEGKKDNKTEWIYRGSTRLAPLYLELQAAERTRARPLPRAQAARRYNMPYVEYTRSDEPAEKPAAAPAPQQTQAQIEQEIRRQRAVAKKSTAPAPAPAPAPAAAPAVPTPRDNVTSRVVFYTPKNAIKPHKMVPHTCGPKCKRTDVLALKDLRTYNPLTKPLLSGWERQQVKYRIPAVKAIMYRAPCGRRIRDYKELHQYLQAIDSDMGVDLFDFNPATHCLAEFLLNKCLISKKDLSHGKENVPVPCVNYYDSSLPEFCSYNTERTPTAGVPLNLDPEFLCGCDCTDDCADKSKCACWKMTLEGARTIGLDTNEVGYVYKRLPEPLPSGIYECNSRCKCKQTCLNRVAQHPLQLKLQVFKTANRGWGIRALNDVPKGAFLCVYAGNLLTDATANLDGLNEGDEYLAELDYIEVVEQMKEGFEEDIPEDAKKLDEEEGSSSSLSSSEDDQDKKDADDDDFRPAMPAGQYAPSEYSKRLRKREKSKKAKEKEEKERKEREDKLREKDGEDCITISDDEELREPAHFSVQTGMKGKEFISKYKSVRAHFGKDEACYIMDAKVQGNIGRYLNHSCTPNVFVQNVFVDTHDPRFPWVAFFALSQIRAGTELTWNYNYDVGSVPGKVLYCYCNAPNCRGRLL